MSTPFVGEIRLLPYGRTPSGWQVCDGSVLSAAEYELLAALLGATYGGDGSTTVGVPDLRGRVPVHQGTGNGLTNRPLGSAGGSEKVSLTAPQMGPHSHLLYASTTAGTANTPAGNVPAAVPAALGQGLYATVTTASEAFAASTVQTAGAGASHDNTAPTVALQYYIATAGIFPTQQ